MLLEAQKQLPQEPHNTEKSPAERTEHSSQIVKERRAWGWMLVDVPDSDVPRLCCAPPNTSIFPRIKRLRGFSA
jgi:hypothetical protein